jgi:hypothetical protein
LAGSVGTGLDGGAEVAGAEVADDVGSVAVEVEVEVEVVVGDGGGPGRAATS